MPYTVTVLHQGFTETADENLTATCTSTLIRGKENVIVNTMGYMESEKLIKLIKEHGMLVSDITCVVSTNSEPGNIGNNHLFLTALQIVGNSFISHGNTFYQDQFADGKPYKIDGDDLKVVSTPGHTLDDVTVLVKTGDKATVAITGDLFVRHEDSQNDDIWLAHRSECPIVQRYNRHIIANMVDYIIPGHGGMFKVTKSIKTSFHRRREAFRRDDSIMMMTDVW